MDIYTNISITGNTYHITNSTTKPKNYNEGIDILKKIDFILKNNLKYSTDHRDNYSILDDYDIKVKLKETANGIKTKFDEKASKLNWIEKQVYRISKKKKIIHYECKQIEYSITPPKAMPNIPSDILKLIGGHLDVKDAVNLTRLNRDGKKQGANIVLQKAHAFGYIGNNEVEARQFMEKLFDQVKLAKTRMSKKYFVTEKGKLNVEASLKKLESLPTYDLIYLVNTLNSEKAKELIAYLAKHSSEMKQSPNLSNSTLFRLDTLFIEAAHYNNLNLLKILLKHGANKDVLVERGPTLTLVQYAISSKDINTDTVKLLVDNKANVNKVGDNPYPPLELAIKRDNYDPKIIKILIDAGANLNAINPKGDKPIHVASQYNRIDSVQQLLDHEVDINSKDAEGKTPLFLACVNKNTDMIRFLIDQKADINTPNYKGTLPIHILARQGDSKNMKVFLDKKADTSKTDENGDLLPHIFAKNGDMGNLKLLINYGVNINVPNAKGEYPIHIAMRNGNLDMLKFLMDQKVNINVKGPDGNSPLHLAVKYPMLVDYLLDHGADPQGKNDNGNTPFHMAAALSNPTVLQKFLARGFNINAKGYLGLTALSIAMQKSKDKTVVGFLLENGANPHIVDDNNETAAKIARSRFPKVYNIMKKNKVI